MTRQLTTLVEGGNYFECPRWHDGRWWAVDFYRHTVFTYDADGREEPVLEVEGQPSGLGWLPDGDLLVVSMKDRRVLRRASDGTVSEHADVSALTTGHLNDMIVDRKGVAYAGNFGFDLMGGGDPGDRRASCGSTPTAARARRPRTSGSPTAWSSPTTARSSSPRPSARASRPSRSSPMAR